MANNSTNYYCLGFLFDGRLGQVALIRKEKPSWQAGYLNGIGGKIETGESPEQAMAREFKEETGFDTKVDDWTLFCSLTGIDKDGNTWSIECFHAVTWKNLSENIKQMEIEKPEIVSIEYIVHAGGCIQNLHWLIPMALNSICADHPEYYQIKENINNGEASKRTSHSNI